MASETSTAPSGMTITSEWKFSMRSSRAVSAEAEGKRTARSAAAKRNRIRWRGKRIGRATVRSLRRGGCVEADFGSFALGRCRHFEEFPGLEAEHVGENIGGELLNLGVEVANDGVVVAAGVLGVVLDLGEGVLQRGEALDGAELGIGFREREEAFQGAGEHVLGLRFVARTGCGHGAGARVDDCFEGALFV